MKVLTSISIIVLVAVIAYLFTGWEECSFEEKDATERIIDVLNRASQDPAFLSAPSFQKEDCSYSYMYKDESNKIHYIFTGWGEVHKWDYANGEGP